MGEPFRSVIGNDQNPEKVAHAAKASKRRAHVCDSWSDDEPLKKSKKAVGTELAPQTLGDAETDLDGEIRDQ